MERAKFRKNSYDHLPCDTYACESRADLTMGGSDANMFDWVNICIPCAVNLIKSAFDIPELREALFKAAADLPEFAEYLDVKAEVKSGQLVAAMREAHTQSDDATTTIYEPYGIGYFNALEFLMAKAEGREPLYREAQYEAKSGVALSVTEAAKKGQEAHDKMVAAIEHFRTYLLEEHGIELEEGESPIEAVIMVLDALKTEEDIEPGEEETQETGDIDTAQGDEKTEEQPESFRCPSCEFEAKSAIGLNSHVRAKHPEPSTMVTSQDEALK